MTTKAAGKGHDSWVRFPGLSMVLQGLVVEMVFAPGFHVYLSASGVYSEAWAATADGRTAALRTMIICVILTYFARAFTRIRTKWLLDAVWFVVPVAIAIAAWGQAAAAPVASWFAFRQAWMLFASTLKSSGRMAPLTLTDSAKRLALPPSRILIAADAVPPKVSAGKFARSILRSLAQRSAPRDAFAGTNLPVKAISGRAGVVPPMTEWSLSRARGPHHVHYSAPCACISYCQS
jgi:hypothetical protein